jgi:hypothetical protein
VVAVAAAAAAVAVELVEVAGALAVVAVGLELTLELLEAAGCTGAVVVCWGGEDAEVGVLEPARGSMYCWSPAEVARATAGVLSTSTPSRAKQLTMWRPPRTAAVLQAVGATGQPA